MQIRKKTCIFALAILSFSAQSQNMNRTTGLGGIFIKANNPKVLAKWYEDHLGIPFGNNLYFAFSWREKNSAFSPASTSIGIFSDTSDYFNPSEKKLMLNLRVDNLEELLKVL